MKNLLILIISAILISTCNNKTIDTVPPKTAITDFLEKYHTAFNAKDIETIKAMLSDGGLFCGTDSKDLLMKDSLIEFITKIFADSTFKPNYKVEKREIRIAANNTNAITLEQFTIVAFSQKIPIRFISHLHKQHDGWKFDFGSYSYTPNNNDMDKINKALE